MITHLQFDVVENCEVNVDRYYTAKIWWLDDGKVWATGKQFGDEYDAWKWIEDKIKEDKFASPEKPSSI